MITKANIVIEGKVQGVGYRAWAKCEAERLGLVGWVKNSSNGNVEALLEGDECATSQFIELCKTGSPLSRVSKVNVSLTEVSESSLKTFVIRY